MIVPIQRCPRCATRPLTGMEATCPRCALDLVQVRADMVLLMRPASARRALSRTPVSVPTSAYADAEPEPIVGAVRDCPACGAPCRFEARHALPGGTTAAAWVCDGGHVAIEDFRC